MHYVPLVVKGWNGPDGWVSACRPVGLCILLLEELGYKLLTSGGGTGDVAGSCWGRAEAGPWPGAGAAKSLLGRQMPWNLLQGWGVMFYFYLLYPAMLCDKSL